MSDHPGRTLMCDNGSDLVSSSSGTSVTSTSSSRSAISASQLPRPQSRYRLLRKMVGRLLPSAKEFILLVILSFAAASLLGGTRMKTRSAPPARAFFHEASLVHDFPNGNLEDAFGVAANSVFTLVCYYAPWDSESQTIRDELDQVSRVFYDHVTFLAVNCWNTEGSCRNRFSKIPYYPVLVMHVRGYKGIVYRGPLKAGYIGRFVAEAAKRMLRIDSAEEVDKILMTKDVLVVGYFDVKGPAIDPSLPREYLLFYSAALKALELDAVGDVAFGVVVDPLVASELGLKDYGISVITWLHFEAYPHFANFTQSGEVDRLVDWVFRTAMRSVEWVTLKSGSLFRGHALSKFMADGPTLVLFTPRNPWMATNPYYQLLVQLSAEYINCDDHDGISSFASEIALNRRRSAVALKRWEEECSSMPTEPTEVDCPARLALSSTEDSQVCCSCFSPEVEVICDACVAETKSSCSPLASRTSALKEDQEEREGRCWTTRDGLTSFCCCRQGPHLSRRFNDSVRPIDVFLREIAPSSSRGQSFGPVEDDRVASAIRHEKELKCRMLAAANLSSQDHPSSDLTGGRMDAIRGLRCFSAESRRKPREAPRPLSFVAMDSQLHPEFRLNVGIQANSSDTFAVIIDLREESHFVLDRRVTEKSLAQFVRNFTLGASDRAKFDVKQRTDSRTRFGGDCVGANCVRVPEVSADDFEEVVINRRQDLVIFFYAPWCGFCIGAGHVLLTVAHLFADFSSEVRFVRVNGDENTLPWEYDMPSFPTVLYLPNDRRKDSRIFPLEEMPLDTENLLKFVLANVPVKTRWKFALTDCDEHCATRLRVSVRDKIRSLLSRYRVAVRDGLQARPKLRSLFRKLQHYRAMYWAFTDPDVVLRSEH